MIVSTNLPHNLQFRIELGKNDPLDHLEWFLWHNWANNDSAHSVIGVDGMNKNENRMTLFAHNRRQFMHSMVQQIAYTYVMDYGIRECGIKKAGNNAYNDYCTGKWTESEFIHDMQNDDYWALYADSVNQKDCKE